MRRSTFLVFSLCASALLASGCASSSHSSHTAGAPATDDMDGMDMGTGGADASDDSTSPHVDGMDMDGVNHDMGGPTDAVAAMDM